MANSFIYHSINSTEEILSWKHLLRNYSLEKINREIDNYKTSCHIDSSIDNRIQSVINSLFNIDFQGHKFFPHFKYNIEPKGVSSNIPYYFFRIRKFSEENEFESNDKGIRFETLNIKEFQALADVWERPSEHVNNYQRLNKPHQSVLYTSLMSSTAILETRLKEKDFFALIVYKHKSNFSYSDCSRFIYLNELSEEENMKRYILFNFLREEFTRILPDSYSEGNQYCAAYHISHKFFIGENTQAIQYPSTRGLGHCNFAFWGNIHEYLDFVGFRVAILASKKGTQSDMMVFADSFWNDKLNKFEYFSPNSDKSKQIFGDPYLAIY